MHARANMWEEIRKTEKMMRANISMMSECLNTLYVRLCTHVCVLYE